MGETRTAHRTCPLCEATCGLELTVMSDPPALRKAFSHGAPAAPAAATAGAPA